MDSKRQRELKLLILRHLKQIYSKRTLEHLLELRGVLQECVSAGESSAYHKILKCFVDKMKNDNQVSFQDLENVKFIFENV